MHFQRHFQYGRNLLQQQYRKNYQNNISQSSIQVFSFRKGMKCICFREQKLEIQPLLYEYLNIGEDSKIIKSYLLDEDLAIIKQDFSSKYLEDQFNKTQCQNQQEHPNYQHQSYFSQTKLSYLTEVFQIPQIEQKPIIYHKNINLNDFLIGRTNFVRENHSHKITSDLISKQHCKISHFKNNSSQVQNYLKLIKQILVKKTPVGSKMKRIPTDIWYNILQYLKPKQKYSITDLNSRNGTWIYQVNKQIYKLEQGFDYQFEKETYSIHISKIYTSKDSSNQSILNHNLQVLKYVESFKQEVKWNYYQRASKILIIQNFESLARKQDQKIQLMIFKLKYRDFHEYYLLAIKESSNKKFNVGCKYEIDVNPQQYDSPSLHGKIYVQNGSWMIESFQLKRNGQYRKVWTRMVKDYEYYLNTSKSYRIRLGAGSGFFFSLQFLNF